MKLATAVRSGDRAALGRAITLVESNRQDHQAEAQELLAALMPETGRAIRVGVTGVPGAGKSTFIDAMGTLLTTRGLRVAVLAVDPTSGVSGGSILGDKTRMPRLAVDPQAFIRPSPSSGTLGGVGRKTRESILVCEAAGYDVILVETVGVGQSETLVAGMVDCFLVLMLPGAGDELQGIKRGILELADLIAVNKADGDNVARANAARSEVARAVHLLRPKQADWRVPVVTCSGLTGAGIDRIWEQVLHHREVMTASGAFDALRRRQLRDWMWAMIDEGVLASLRAHPDVAELLADLEPAVVEGRVAPASAAERVLAAFFGGPGVSVQPAASSE
jgi:LAO/AO transport system kinase